MPFVLDASITISWCFGDEATPKTTALLDSLVEDQAYVPTIWPLEIGNVLVVAQRRKKLTFADAAQFLNMLQQLAIHIDLDTADKSFHEIYSLAHTEGLTTYDAAYLELAMRLGLPLATKDQLLIDVCKRLKVSLAI